MNVNGKTEVRRQVSADLAPLVASVVAAHHVPVLLHEKNVGTRRMHRDAVHTMTDFRVGIGQLIRRFQAAIYRLPRLAAIICAEDARRRDRYVDPMRIGRMEQDRVQAHSTRARLPQVSLRAAQGGKLLPRFTAVHRLEESGVFRAGVDGIRIGERRLEMPDALEFPRMLRAVVPLVSAHLALVDEFVTFPLGHTVLAGQLVGVASRRIPSLAAVIRALDHLAKPAARLRCIKPIWFNR